MISKGGVPTTMVEPTFEEFIDDSTGLVLGFGTRAREQLAFPLAALPS